ncbi:MAG: LytTR family DNA-binding domain-containing protein [Bacteroidota bacterium]
MTCIIIEDQPPAQRILKKYITDIGSLQLAATFSDALKAVAFLKKEAVDLVFLDIHLPKISGIDFLETLPNPPHIILTTAFSDYALQSYEFSVVDYLLKPFSFQRFMKAVNKVPITASNNDPSNSTFIFIKSGYEYIRVEIAEILYIQSDADYTEIYLPNKKYLSSEPLRHWLETLPQELFVRVHKSFIINSAQIEKIASSRVHLFHHKVIPIGRAYKEDFLAQFLK